MKQIDVALQAIT